MIAQQAEVAPVRASPRVNGQIPRVADTAKQRLRDSGYHILTSVSCDYREGVLILRGCVPTYYMKQIAQTVVQNIEEISQIDNRLEVG